MKHLVYLLDSDDSFYGSFITKTGYFLQTTYGKKLSDMPHSHVFYELMYLIDGDCVQTINGIDYTCIKGDFIFLRPGDIHYFKAQSDNVSIMCLSVVCEEVENFLKVSQFFKKAVELSTENKILKLSFAQKEILNSTYLATISHTDIIEQKEYVKILLFNMLQFLAINNLHLFNLNHEKTTDDKFSELLLKMANPQHIKEGMSAMLKISNFSHSHLCRLFKAKYNITPNQYIRNLKINYAFELVTSTQETFESIAEKVGYSSFSHFNKIFKQTFKKTPATVRKEYKNSTL